MNKSDSKYRLRDLLGEIDLYDRKIVHSQNRESFASEADCSQVVAKLAAKRDALAKKAIALIESGVEFDLSALPISFKQAFLPIEENI
ncbi:MAG TPA: hypothetical protein VN577_11410 [Terriglobales bacterium]|nr:hypothetical protein [Terriglobales bacterium]